MAEAFPSEKSTKDVINDILDDYEKLTKYVIISVFSSVLFCKVWLCSEIKMVNPDSAMTYFHWKLFASLL